MHALAPLHALALAASLLACTRAGVEGERDPAADTKPDTKPEPKPDETPTMQTLAIETLATGFMRERNDGARVFTFVDAASWSTFVEDMRNAEYVDIAARVSPLPEVEDAALLFVEFPDGAGSEFAPVVDAIAREADVLVVRGHWQANPSGAATDDVTRQWVLVRAPKAALEGSPTTRVDIAD